MIYPFMENISLLRIIFSLFKQVLALFVSDIELGSLSFGKVEERWKDQKLFGCKLEEQVTVVVCYYSYYVK
jgi:hypothetical protein